MGTHGSSLDRAHALRLLRQDPILSQLDEPRTLRLAAASEIRVLDAGEVLVRAGSPADRVIHLAEGKLALFRTNPQNRITLLLGVVEAPAVVGDAEAAALAPWMCTVRAEEDATCLLMDRRAFFDAIRSHAEVAYRMYVDASIRHLLANHTAQTVALYDVETRLLRLLLDYAHRFGRVEPDRAFVGRKVSKPELAAALGVASKTILRAMKPLFAKGVLTEDPDGSLVIRGLDALTAELPPDLFGLSSRMGESARPLPSRWQDEE